MKVILELEDELGIDSFPIWVRNLEELEKLKRMLEKEDKLEVEVVEQEK